MTFLLRRKRSHSAVFSKDCKDCFRSLAEAAPDLLLIFYGKEK